MGEQTDSGKVKIIALTGGACSGKTTLLERLRANGDRTFGHRMFYIPEASTTLTHSGMSFSEDAYNFQRAILNTQVALEDACRNYADTLGTNACVICDRGTLDGAAYLGEERFEELLDEEYVTREDLMARYDGVIYLVSAAIGAPEHYTAANNDTRRETLEEAIELEKRTIKCWEDHPNIAIIDNEGNKPFEDKMYEAMRALESMLRAS